VVTDAPYPRPDGRKVPDVKIFSTGWRLSDGQANNPAITPKASLQYSPGCCY